MLTERELFLLGNLNPTVVTRDVADLAKRAVEELKGFYEAFHVDRASVVLADVERLFEVPDGS